MRISISTEIERWVTRERDPEDSWDRGDTAGHVDNVYAVLTPDADPDVWWGESAVIDLEGVGISSLVYAVVADYSSGSTFGRDGGHSQILDAFLSREEAEGLVKAALADTDKKSGYNFSFSYNDKDYHKDWEGYFESLNSLDVWELSVRSQGLDPFRPSGSYMTSVKRGH